MLFKLDKYKLLKPPQTNFNFDEYKDKFNYEKTKLKDRDDYYYLFGLKFLNKYTTRRKNGKRVMAPRYKFLNINLEDKKVISELYISKYGKFPLYEYIPFEYWAEHNSLQGESASIINHPVFQMAEGYVLADHKKNFDILVICSCSDSKPYDRNINYRQYKKICKGKADLVILSDSGIIPLKFSYYYPFLHYNWNHSNDTKELEELFIYYSMERIKRFCKKFPYKKVILIAPRYAVYERLYEKIISSIKEYNFTINFLYDEKTWNKHQEIFKTYSLAKLRALGSKVSQNRLIELLGE